jgi:hypothetical protein
MFFKFNEECHQQFKNNILKSNRKKIKIVLNNFLEQQKFHFRSKHLIL